MRQTTPALPPRELALGVGNVTHNGGRESLGDVGFLEFRQRRIRALLACFHIGHCHPGTC